MLVTFNPDGFGGVSVAPVSDAHQSKLAAHCRQFHPGHDGTAYLQEWDLDGLLPARKLREVLEGYHVTVRMDAWTFGNLLGYDAQEVEL